MSNRTMVSSDRELEETLRVILSDDVSLDAMDGPEVTSVRTFEDVGMLTRDRGLVVRLRNGAEFQITIVQSREAEGTEDEEDQDEEEVK